MDIDNQNLMDSQCPLQLEAQPIYNAMDGGAILATILANSVATNNQLGILQQGVQNVQEQTTNLIAGLQEVYRLIEELKNNNNKSREPNDARKITTMSQNPLNNVTDSHNNEINLIHLTEKLPGLMNGIHNPQTQTTSKSKKRKEFKNQTLVEQ